MRQAAFDGLSALRVVGRGSHLAPGASTLKTQIRLRQGLRGLQDAEQHAYFGRTEQERLAATIPGARLTVYPEAGTSPHWERPERVAADLDAFVRAT